MCTSKLILGQILIVIGVRDQNCQTEESNIMSLSSYHNIVHLCQSCKRLIGKFALLGTAIILLRRTNAIRKYTNYSLPFLTKTSFTLVYPCASGFRGNSASSNELATGTKPSAISRNPEDTSFPS